LTEDDRKRGLNKEASNSISESNHASSSYDLYLSKTIRLDHAAAVGQSRANNDFGRGHEALVTGRSAVGGKREREYGAFHTMPIELQQSIIQAGKESAKRMRKAHDDDLKIMNEEKSRKAEIAMEKKLDETQKEYIDAIECYEQYHSPRCWMTVEDAKNIYNALGSESARLKAVQEQILIRFLGLGWEKAHHPWSKDSVAFTSKQLLAHLMNVVIPLADVLKVPAEAPLKMPAPPPMKNLGTTSDLALDIVKGSDDKLAEFKAKTNATLQQMYADGERDNLQYLQRSIKPKIEDMEGFKLEYYFQMTNKADQSTYNDWAHGVIINVINARTRTVKVKWHESCVNKDEGEQDETIEKLMVSKWNPNRPTSGAWREYLRK